MEQPDRSTGPEWLFSFPWERLGDIAFRLLACAACRRIWHLLPQGYRAAVEMAEQYAEGCASEDELVSALEAARAECPFDPGGRTNGERAPSFARAAVVAACGVREDLRYALEAAAVAAAFAAHPGELEYGNNSAAYGVHHGNDPNNRWLAERDREYGFLLGLAQSVLGRARPG